jgi:hypothetical protein
MNDLAAKIAGLTDRQALSILDSLAGEFSTDETPEGQQEQSQALQTLLQKEHESVDLDRLSEAEIATAAASARQLLLLMSEIPDIQPSLEQWLENPPQQEAAAVPLILAAPIVLTGCIVLLQVAGHAYFKRNADGTWEVGYDPAKEGPLDRSMKDIVKTLADLMRSMLPGG